MIEPLEYSRNGPLLLFTHANGYPPESYRTFLNPFLSDYQVKGFYLRPFWPEANPESVSDWRVFRDDYLLYLEKVDSEQNKTEPEVNHARGIIAVGHSVGAMTSLMAAIKRPEIFRALVLIEPVLFPPLVGLIMRMAAPFNMLRQVHPIIRRTLWRRVVFSSREEMFSNYRGKPIFSRLSDDVLRDYVSGLSSDTPDGSVILKYSPAWEMRIYETSGIADGYVWRNLPKIPCPVLILRGEESDILRARVVWMMEKLLSNGQAFTMPETGHLAPLEAPCRTAQLVIEFLESV
jgi:pimeloyl-ACP methyl ester carboxylesterase